MHNIRSNTENVYNKKANKANNSIVNNKLYGICNSRLIRQLKEIERETAEASVPIAERAREILYVCGYFMKIEYDTNVFYSR